MKLGDIIKVTIHDQGEAGEGIALYNNMVVFIKKAVIGDEVEAKVETLKKNYAIAKLMKIITPSDKRVEPPCEYFKSCGGCQLMNLTYEAQLELKRKKVKDTLERIGGIDTPVKPVMGMEDPFYYRNKTIYPVLGDKIGIFKEKSHSIIEVDRCLIHDPMGDQVLRVVRDHLKRGLQGYDEKTHRGVLRHVMLRSHDEEYMVVLVTHEDGDLTSLVEDLVSIGISHVIENKNHRKGNTILSKENKILHGDATLKIALGDLTFNLSPQSFFQVNTEQTLKLYDEVKRMANLTGSEIVYDIYAGMGTIGSYLARNAKVVYAVEVVEEAVEDGIRSAKENSLTNLHFLQGDAKEAAKNLKEEVDVVIVDPPRKGLDASLIDTINEMNPKRIVYVSCKPSSLARDLKLFKEKGFKTLEVQPVDLFPHTTHVETVVLMSRKG